MNIETVFEGIRYTLSNGNNKAGDKVFPIGRGRVDDNDKFILNQLDYSRFPHEPHTILNTNHSDYKPYQISTDHGYGPIESYYKIIKKEHRVSDGKMFSISKWEEIKDEK